jgi:hypothetical protein
MISEVATLLGGNVMVATTEGRGFTPEEIAERALDKIIYVGGNTHPAIREQAEAFKDSIRQVLIHYMHEAVRSHNVTLVNKFHKAGHPELIPILDA